MICPVCKKNPATHMVKLVINKKLTELPMCQSCMRDKEKELGLTEGALSIYAVEVEPNNKARLARVKPLACPHCGTTYSEFRISGLLGCQRCYSAFAPQVETILRHINGSSVYSGTPYKSPIKPRFAKYLSMDGPALSTQIETAVREENFEKAAFLRDLLAMKTTASGKQRDEN